MPVYRVWYRNNDEPLEFATPGRSSEAQIVRHVLEHEGLGEQDRNALGPVRYTEDESEMNTIG
jgi:hypothetical protein